MIGSKLQAVSNYMMNASWGAELETIGVLGHDAKGNVTVNGITLNDIIDRLTNSHEGVSAIQFFWTPVMTSIVGNPEPSK